MTLEINRDQLAGVFKSQREIIQFETLGKEIEAATLALQNLNLQIATLQASITAAQNDIGALQADISTVQSDISSAQGDITTLQSDINSLQTNVASLEVDDLVDVLAASPSNNDLLTYVTANNRWEKTDSVNATSLTASGAVSGATVAGQITDASANLISSSADLTDGVGISTATLTNAPSSGDPTKWVPVNDNGTTRYIPTW